MYFLEKSFSVLLFEWISSIFRWGIYGAAGWLFSWLFLWKKWDLDFSGSRLSSLGLHYRPAHHRLSNEAQNQNNNFWRLTVCSLIFFHKLKYFLGKLALKYRRSQLTVIKIIKIHQVKQNFSVKLMAKKDLQLDLNYKGRFSIIWLTYFVKNTTIIFQNFFSDPLLKISSNRWNSFSTTLRKNIEEFEDFKLFKWAFLPYACQPILTSCGNKLIRCLSKSIIFKHEFHVMKSQYTFIAIISGIDFSMWHYVPLVRDERASYPWTGFYRKESKTSFIKFYSSS